MKFLYRKGNIDIEHEGKTARFWGDLCINGFAAMASTMEWLSPDPARAVTECEKKELMRAVALHFKGIKDRVFFVDDKGNELNP